MAISRRDFIRIGAAGTAATALGTGAMSEWWGLDRYAVADPGTEGDEVIATFCELCFWKCGVLAHKRDGRVTKLVGNPKHPLSRGRLCPRGTGGTGLLYDPDRLRQPLLRVRSRGEDVFEPVSWDHALDFIAERLSAIRDEHGPEAVALFSHGFGGGWFKHLFKAYGTRNIAGPSYAQCRGPREEGYRLTIGRSLGSPEPIDIDNTRCLTLIGSHLGENMHNTQVQELADGLDRGMGLVVVDPRYSVAASKADHWLPIRPGTDTALLLAWIHVLLDEQRYDRDYVEAHAVGLDELREAVVDKTPEWAYVRTGIRPDLIRQTARFISAARPASLIHPGRRAVWYGNDTQRARAMAILAALLGSFGRRGGYLEQSKMSVPPIDTPEYPTPSRPPADMVQEQVYPFANERLASSLIDASIPGTAEYDIKGWFVYGTNLIHSVPKMDHTIEAIRKLDLLVSVDVLPAEICGWSDVVLPESTYLERYDDLWTPRYKQPFVALRQPVVAPMYDSKPGSWIARELGLRLGLEAHFPLADAEQVIRQRCERAELDIVELARDGVILGDTPPTCEEEGLGLAFPTPSGRIELHSATLEEAGFAPVPEFQAPEEPGPGYLRVLSGRSPVHTFGRTTNNAELLEVAPGNEVWLNAGLAAGLPGFEGAPLRDGEHVVLINQDDVRSEPVRIRLTQRIRGDCVYMVHGFGHTARGLSRAAGNGAAHSRMVTRSQRDPLMGGTALNTNFVRLERAEVRA